MSLVKKAMTQTRAMSIHNGAQPIGSATRMQAPSKVKMPLSALRQHLAKGYGSGTAKVVPTMGRP